MSQQVNVRVADDAQADLIRRIARVLRDQPDKAKQLQAVLDGESTQPATGRLRDLESRVFEIEALLNVTPVGLRGLDEKIAAGKTDKAIAELHNVPAEVVRNRRNRLEHEAPTAKPAKTTRKAASKR